MLGRIELLEVLGAAFILQCHVGPFCLKFLAAVSASCSGDKSDKEESAGRLELPRERFRPRPA